MVELGEVGEDTPPVQLLSVRHVSDVQQGRDVQLRLGQSEGELTVPEKNYQFNSNVTKHINNNTKTVSQTADPNLILVL